MIQAVIFDFDDTLARSWQQKWAHHKHTARESYGIELTDEKIREHWGEPYAELVAHLYNSADTKENMIAENQKTKDQFPKLPMEGVAAVVRALREREFLLGIITSTLTSFVLHDLGLVGLSPDDFFHVQGADMTEVHKPHPGVFDLVLAKLSERNISKEEIVYVGDSVVDADAAKAAGIGFIGITSGIHTEEELQQHHALFTIDDIQKLPDVVFSSMSDAIMFE